MKNPGAATAAEITAMGAEIERLHARLKLLNATGGLTLEGTSANGEPAINMSGATVNIHSSFGDADVEKVLAAFRRDLIKSVAKRYTAPTEWPDPAQASAPAEGESKEGIASGVPGGGDT